MELQQLDCGKVRRFSLSGMAFDARVVDVYDGDTITAVFKYRGEYNKWPCRLDGIDTPELKTKNDKEKLAAGQARDYLRNLILDKIVRLVCGEFDKYGRLLVKVIDEYGQNVNELLIFQGYAKDYHGGAKIEWEGV